MKDGSCYEYCLHRYRLWLINKHFLNWISPFPLRECFKICRYFWKFGCKGVFCSLWMQYCILKHSDRSTEVWQTCLLICFLFLYKENEEIKMVWNLLLLCFSFFFSSLRISSVHIYLFLQLLSDTPLLPYLLPSRYSPALLLVSDTQEFCKQREWKY